MEKGKGYKVEKCTVLQGEATYCPLFALNKLQKVTKQQNSEKLNLSCNTGEKHSIIQKESALNLRGGNDPAV